MNIKEQFPTKFLSAADLDGKAHTLKIKECLLEDIGGEEKPVLYFKGGKKGLVLNKTNATIITDQLRSEDTDDWEGEYIVLHTEKVTFGGKLMDSIRVMMGGKAEELRENAKQSDASRKSRGAVAGTATAALEANAGGDDDDTIPF